MRLHQREEIVRKARTDLLEVIADWMRRHDDLTYIERAQLFEQELASCLKYALRVERHGTDQKEGGLE